ncbi:unnamed protein product, partial [Polarella glacialis]
MAMGSRLPRQSARDEGPMASWPECRRSRLRQVVAVLVLPALVFQGCRWGPAGINAMPKPQPPGPLSIRQRTTKLRDAQTGLPRPAPKEADVSLDYFQRTFPEIRTEEHILIRRWEDIADLFGSPEIANQLVQEQPDILRWARRMPRRAHHYLSMYLSPEVATQVVFECPFLLTKRAGSMRGTLPALLNVLGSKKRLQEIAVKYPSLMHVPVGDFYRGMANMIAVSGSSEAALEVAKTAMERVAKSPYKSA